MPKITINERDYTTAGASGISESIVYVPGYVGTNVNTTDSTKYNAVELEIGTITLFRTVEEFTNKIGTSPLVIKTDKDDNGNEIKIYDLSYTYAYELLLQGLPVLYEVVGNEDTEGNITENPVNNISYKKLEDRGLYDIRFLTSGGFDLTSCSTPNDYTGESITAGTSDNSTTIKLPTLIKVRELIACANARGDCIALVDHNKDLEIADTLKEDGNYDAGIISFYNALGNTLGTKKAAGFTPWCTFNTAQGTNTLPGSFAYLKAYANSTVYNGNPIWYAASGSSRGVIPNIIKPLLEYGEVDIQEFQPRTSGAIAINPICNIRPFGYIVWGNRTLSPVGTTSVSQETDLVASNFLNIAHTVCEINKALYDLSRRLTFEQNNDVLWATFNSRIALLLDQIKSGNGISGYRVIRVNSTKRATLEARIRIVPIEAVEDFELTIELSDTLIVVE